MGESAFRDSDVGPQDDSAEEDLVQRPHSHVEFISEIGQVLDMPNVDLDGYVGADGEHMAPHQTPLEVVHQKEDALEHDGKMDTHSTVYPPDAIDVFE
jgi:hypothetical protein